MGMKEAVKTDKAPAPMPFFSQAIKSQGMVYCSGSIGMDPKTNKLIEGSVADRAEQSLKNLSAVLEAAGTSIDNAVKVNVFLTNMQDFAAMNKVYDRFFQKEPKPCRTCVAVHQLPLGTDVEIELTAHQLLLTVGLLTFVMSGSTLAPEDAQPEDATNTETDTETRTETANRPTSSMNTFFQRLGLQSKPKEKMISTPNPRNSKIPYWGEAKNAETDGGQLSNVALGSLKGIPPQYEWSRERPDQLRREADAVLASLAKTLPERKRVESLMKDSKYTTEPIRRRPVDSTLLPEEQEIDIDAEYRPLGGTRRATRAVTPPSEDDSDDEPRRGRGGGRGGGSGNPPGGRGGDPKGPNKRNFADFQRTATEVDIEGPRTKRPRRAARANVWQAQAPVDLPTFNPQPVRLIYEPHKLEEQNDDWFMGMFRQLFVQAQNFVTKFYGVHNIEVGPFFDPWACGVSPEFISWAESVAEPDPAMGGWDTILRNTEQRQWFIMGIVMRIIQRKIFDEGLFGANEEQSKLIHSLERALIQREGFSRQALRSETVRTIIGRSPITENFYSSVATLTAQISLLLNPLTNYLYALAPPIGKQTPDRFDLYQALHNLVSNAAYLSIAIRLSQTIFYFVPLRPGDTYDPDDHLNFSMDAYTKSKEKIVEKYTKNLEQYRTELKPLARRVKVLKAKGYDHTSMHGRNAQMALDAHKLPLNPGNSHRALVGISSWPVITRFKPGSDMDDHLVPGAAYLPDKDGFRIFQISKGGGVFYYGRERRSGVPIADDGIGEGPRERLRLRHWVRERTGQGKGGSLVGKVGQVLVVGAMMGMAWAVKERGFEEVVELAREGLAGFLGEV